MIKRNEKRKRKRKEKRKKIKEKKKRSDVTERRDTFTLANKYFIPSLDVVTKACAVSAG